jgi:hypothetical protein
MTLTVLDETDHDEGRGPRLREIPFRMLIPNLITVLAICAGMTGIRLAFENHIQLAVAMVLVAAFLDGVGRPGGRGCSRPSRSSARKWIRSPTSSISALRRRWCCMCSSLIRRAPLAGSRPLSLPLRPGCGWPGST